jgi:hypothetical protein
MNNADERSNSGLRESVPEVVGRRQSVPIRKRDNQFAMKRCASVENQTSLC